jgi:phosphoribosylanthranilate isomerase
MTKSIRHVDPDEARRIFDAAPGLKKVGVVAKDSVSQILRIAEQSALDVLQLHGNFTAEDCAQIRQEFEGELWCVLGIDERTPAGIENWRDLADSADALLLDTSIHGKSGGTGRAFDWKGVASHVTEMSRELPVVVAGGLSPKNVAAAISALHPAIVDVSSGVESAPGVKSHDMMTAFAHAVLSASIV